MAIVESVNSEERDEPSATVSPMVWILVGYMALFIWRPFEIWPFLGELRLELLYVIFAVVAMLFSSPRLVGSSINFGVRVLVIAVLLSFLVSPWFAKDEIQLKVLDWLKIVVFYFLVVFNVKTESDLRVVIWGFCAAIGLLMAHSIWEFQLGRRMYSMGIPRMLGINQTFRQPNTFSATLIFAAPFYLVAMKHGVTWWMKLGGVIAIFFTAYCVMMTGSRTALIGLVFWALLIVIQQKQRIKILLAMAILAPIVWGFTPERIQHRFRTVIDESAYEEFGSNARTSAEVRTEGFYEGLALLQRFPLTGCGPGAWIPATGWPIESHNLYGQLAGELGLIGIVGFSYYLWQLFQSTQSIRSNYKRNEQSPDFLYDTSRAIEQSVILLLVLGTAGHSLYRFNWIWNASFLAITAFLVSIRKVPRVESDTVDSNVDQAQTN